MMAPKERTYSNSATEISSDCSLMSPANLDLERSTYATWGR